MKANPVSDPASFTAERLGDAWEIKATYPDGVEDALDVYPSELPALNALIEAAMATPETEIQDREDQVREVWGADRFGGF